MTQATQQTGFTAEMLLGGVMGAITWKINSPSGVERLLFWAPGDRRIAEFTRVPAERDPSRPWISRQLPDSYNVPNDKPRTARDVVTRFLDNVNDGLEPEEQMMVVEPLTRAELDELQTLNEKYPTQVTLDAAVRISQINPDEKWRAANIEAGKAHLTAFYHAQAQEFVAAGRGGQLDADDGVAISRERLRLAQLSTRFLDSGGSVADLTNPQGLFIA